MCWILTIAFEKLCIDGKKGILEYSIFIVVVVLR